MTKRELEAALLEVEAEKLGLRDALDDALLGVRLWRDTKVGHCLWDNHDEMLARWVEYANAD